jgi:hypothetical protein
VKCLATIEELEGRIKVLEEKVLVLNDMILRILEILKLNLKKEVNL